MEERCFLCGPCGGDVNRTVEAMSSVDISVVSSVTQSTEAEESSLLEAVAREQLVKTAGWKRLSGCCGN
jgi:hypothetical protein